ncbi:uncharacterized protein BROUX77_001590 [Berkeleyomyces rouxiae]|uniref:uncharacterized protein n=1 Tax=Berkeleyomyces rouxiae TaxID=2035830 RepID=UPI003B795703
MAVLDCEDNVYYPTDHIILSAARKRYNIGIHSQHWQLRALTGLASDNILCFPGGSTHKQIHILNIDTREQLPIKKLPFVPRCLTAGQGWVCCGGEHGEFSAAKIGLAEIPKDGDFNLPSSMSSFRRDVASITTLKSARFVRERVNCVTMWFPINQQSQYAGAITQHPGAYNEPVAVLANNDKSVTLVNLESFGLANDPQPLCSLTYPDYVNRAVISPDGQFLAAVLDDPYLYIHQRTESEDWLTGEDEKAQYTWDLCAKILLKSQYASDKTDRRGSFALAFSPSGQYLTAGTQHGVVSVFRVDKLGTDSQHALIKTFNSSRAGDSNGAIRDMAFCPGKYGLLAWTEDRGRVGIADVSSNFSKRQIIELSESNSFELYDVMDGTETTISTMPWTQQSSLLGHSFETSDFPFSSAFNTHANDILRHSRERDRDRHRAPSPEGLFPGMPFIRYRTPTSGDTSGDTTNATNTRSMLQSALLVSSLRVSHPARTNTSAPTDTAPENGVSGPNNSNSTTQAVDAGPDNPSAQLPRASSGSSFYAGSWRQAGSQESQGMAEVRAHIQSLQHMHPNEDIGQLFTPEIIRDMAEERDRRIAADRTTATQRQIGDSPSDVSTPTTRRGAGTILLHREYLTRRNNLRNIPTTGRDNTSGIAWSSKGDTLYVGSEDGIYEMHVNTSYWKTSESIQFR